MTVRVGTAEDFVACIPMAERFWRVAGYQIPFDADSTLDYFEMGLNAGLFSVAEKNGQVIGFVIGISAPCMVNRNYRVAAELAWWMEPEYRNTPDSVKLVKHIEQLAKDAGVALWSMMCLESQEPDKVENMYMRMGYKRAERTFTKGLN
jgi:GNAT superfamily N-acetyltransferase